MKLILTAILFFISIPPGACASGIFSILNETAYNGSLDIITEYNEPVRDIQTSGHISGWMDIVGFNHTVNINGTRYTNVSSPVIEYDIWDIGLYWNDNLDYIVPTDLRHSVSGNITTAELDVHLLWHHSTLKYRTVPKADGGTRRVPYIHKEYTHEYATLHTVAQSPYIYPDLNITTVSITIYDNSFNPHVDIHVPVQPFEVKTVFTYDNDTITRYNLAGLASTGAVNLSRCLYWEDDSDIFNYRHDIAVLKSTDKASFNADNLHVTTYTPFGHTTQTNYIISTVCFDDSAGMSAGTWTTILTLIIFGWGTIKCLSALGGML